MTVRDFLRLVWDGKWWFFGAVLVVLAVTFAYVSRQDTTYQAVATVQLAAAEGASFATVTSDPGVVTSGPVVEAAAADLKVKPAQVSGGLSGSYDTGSNVMSVYVASTSQTDAVDRANAVAKAVEARLPALAQERSAALDTATQQLRDSLATVRASLANDPEDPLAKAEEEAIVAKFTGIVNDKMALSALQPPGKVAALASSATPLGLGATIYLALGLLAGIAVGIGLALGRAGLDASVRSLAAAAQLAEAPVLAELYGVEKAAKTSAEAGRLPVVSRVATAFTESIRELRTAAEVTIAAEGSIVVLVTATDSKSPRSFIAANLAASWALSGRQTVVVSADLRRRDIEAILPAAPGGQHSGAGARPTQILGLSLCTIPDQGLDPADYLATAGVRELVESLRAEADVVVIDAPPVLAAADATILGGYADGAIVVTTLRKTDQPVLAEATERLRVNHVHVAGLAVSGIESDRRLEYATTYGEADAGAPRGTVAPALATHGGIATGPGATGGPGMPGRSALPVRGHGVPAKRAADVVVPDAPTVPVQVVRQDDARHGHQGGGHPGAGHQGAGPSWSAVVQAPPAESRNGVAAPRR